MSIDFSKVTGLSDSRGNIVQITDAAGRVLWSAVPAFDGTIILRPSADISVDSTIALVPPDATAAYLLVNEEVSDGEATMLNLDANNFDNRATGAARFVLGGYVPKNISRVKNIYVVASGDGDPHNDKDSSTSRINFLLRVGGMTQYYFMPNTTGLWNNFFDSKNFDPIELFVYTKSEDGGGTFLGATTEELCAEINAYISANGTLPNMELTLDMMVKTGDSKESGYVRVSQVYVALECE